MNFECAELLSLDHSYDFFGDIFNYRNRQNMTISSRIYGNPSISGAYIVWTGMSGMLVQLNDNIPVLINGVNLGTGRLVSVNFEPGTDVQYKKYKVGIELLKTGNLWNMDTVAYSGGSHSGYYYNLDVLKSGESRWISNLSETFNFQANNNKTYSYEQSVSFELDQDSSSSIYGSRDELAANLGNLMLAESPGFPFFLSQYPSFYKNSGIKYDRESFDIVNGRYSFSRTFNFDTGRPWIWEYSHSLNYNSTNGESTVTEQGLVKSVAKTGVSKSYYSNLGWTGTVETGIYARCSGAYVYAYNSNPFIGACNLINYPVDASVLRNDCIGEIQYSKTYTNNLAQKTGYVFSYTQSIGYDSDGYVTVGENGTYRGLNGGRSVRYAAASGAYYSGQSFITGRLTGIYNNYLKLNRSGCNYSGSLTNIQKSETFEEFNGIVSYDYAYSDNPNYYSSGNFRRILNRYSTTAPIHIVNKFFVPNVGEITQGANQSTLGVFSNNIEIVGTSGVPLQSYLDSAFSGILQPTGSDVHLIGCNYSFSPLNYIFSLQMDYAFSTYKLKEDVFV